MLRALFKLISRFHNTVLYGIIGVSAVVVDMSVFYVLFNFFHVFPVLATVLSVATATLYSFFTNAYLNFHTKDLLKRRMASFIFVSGIGMALSAWSIYFFTTDTVSANLVKVLSLPPIVTMQYLLNANITFRKRRDPGAEKEKKREEEFSSLVSRQWRAHKKVAVIGGGFTGLTAAYELSKQGYKVTLFEAGDTLGGLVAGFYLDGVPLERAYHFLYKTDSEMISMAEEVGVRDKLHFYQSSLSLYYDNNLYPFMTPKDLLSFTPLTLLQRIRAGVVALYLSWETRWHSFAKVTALKWLRRWCGKRATEVIWEPILRGKFFNFYDSIAMSYVWSRVYVRANSKDPGDATEKLGYFDGGFQTFSNALAKKAQKRGVKVVYNASIESIEHRDGKVHVKRGNGVDQFDAALSTTPSHVFSRLVQNDPRVTPEYVKLLNSIDYLGAVLMVFATDEKFTDYYWHNINDAEHPFLVLLSLSALVGPEKLNGKNIYYIGAYLPHDHKYFTASDDTVKSDWIKGVQKIFPHFKESTITDSHVFRFKNAQHIVDAGYEKKIPPYRSPVPGVFLSNFSQIFPDDRGTNYAVMEGRKVARLLDHDLVDRTYEEVHPDNNEGTRLKDPDVSVILPTFNESGNIATLVKRTVKTLKSTGLSYECIFVDDSNDKTPYVIAGTAKKHRHVYMIKRTGKDATTGLTKAFYRGFQSARGRTVVCMDTDLQHPPEKIPELIKVLETARCDVAVASRYTGSGSSLGLSGFYRKLVSKASTYVTWILLPATRSTTDPMTGFFAFRRDILDKVSFSSFGFKILVELLVVGKRLKVVDVPFTFAKRIHEGSKASFSQGIRFFKDISILFFRDQCGSLAVKYFLVISTFFGVYIIAVWSGGIAQFTSLFQMGDLSSKFLGLILINIVLAPLVFWLLFNRTVTLSSKKGFSIPVLWIILNSWAFVIVSNTTFFGAGFSEIIGGSIVFTLVSIAVLFLFRPIWTWDSASIRSQERWIITGIGIFVFFVTVSFLPFTHTGYLLFLIAYALIITQGLFALYLMIYTWDIPHSNEKNTESQVLPFHSFTAIIPCKHEKSVISDTLKTISTMEYPEKMKQVLVVIHKDTDDGTIEVAEQAIKEIGKENIEVVTYNEDPVNKPHGLNQALKRATGEYVVIFDAEDDPHPRLFQIVNETLMRERYDVLQSGVQLMDFESSWYSLFNVLEYYFWFKSSLHFFARHGVVPLGGVTVFFSREWLERVGGWDNNCLTEDAEIGLRLSQAGAKIGVIYDAEYVTQEETPHALWGFIKQRTRWAQGFLQILFRGEWRKLPDLRARFLAIYVLAWPLVLIPLTLIFPLGIILSLVFDLPPTLALLANVPLLLFLMFVTVQVLGLYEFCKDHGKTFPWARLPMMVVMFYPFTLILAFSGSRALYRNIRNMTAWEKTEHSNAYRTRQQLKKISPQVSGS